MDYWEQKYKDLECDYRRLRREHEELKEQYNKARSDLYSANFKIETELVPRIKAERRSYDNWVTNPMRGESK